VRKCKWTLFPHPTPPHPTPRSKKATKARGRLPSVCQLSCQRCLAVVALHQDLPRTHHHTVHRSTSTGHEFSEKISSRSISHSENFGNPDPHIQIETKTWNAGNYVGNIIMFTWKRVCRSFGLMRWAKQEVYPTGTGYCPSKKEGLEKDRRSPVKGLSNTIYRCDV